MVGGQKNAPPFKMEYKMRDIYNIICGKQILHFKTWHGWWYIGILCLVLHICAVPLLAHRICGPIPPSYTPYGLIFLPQAAL